MPPASPRPGARNARWAVSAIFFINGATIGSWAAHIPVVQERLSLSHSALGVVLLAMAAGALISMPLAGGLAARRGSAFVTRISGLLFSASFILLALAPSPLALALALFAFGGLNGAMDVAMNAHAVAVEDAMERPVMSSFHGMFSLGGLAGAGLAAVLITVMPASIHAVLVAGLGVLGVAIAQRYLLPVGADASAAAPVFAIPTRGTLLMGGLAFMAFGSEGAILDWSALHLRTGLGLTPGLAATGFAAFSATMALGRFGGDWLRGRTSGPAVVRWSALLAAIGLSVSLLTSSAILAVLGFAIVGLGMANLVPVMFTAAGKLPGQTPGAGIAAMATMGYTGFLAGPPVIGFVAEVTSLTVALGLVVACCLAVAVFAGVVRVPDRASA